MGLAAPFDASDFIGAKAVEEFERDYCEPLGVPHGIGVANGPTRSNWRCVPLGLVRAIGGYPGQHVRCDGGSDLPGRCQMLADVTTSASCLTQNASRR